MKKIIALFVVMLAFGLNANAQQKKAAVAKPAVKQELSSEQKVEQASKSDLNALTAVVTGLNQTQKDDFYNLFSYKNKMLLDTNLSDERKAVIAQTIEAKLKASLQPEDIQKLEGKPEVMRKLTH